jgi:outer membrane protein OmpA-like peptidoglycan-associated protein
MLEELGVDGKRISAKGYGSLKPIASNTTEEGRAKNRRTEFLIVE